MAAAPELADRALRPLADAIRDRRRRPHPRRLPGMGAAPRAPARGAARPSRPALDPPAAERPLDAALPEPRADGGLLHGAAIPADRPGSRRARNRRADAPGI